MSATSLSLDDLVLDPARYAALRPGVRAEAIALRRQRRVHVGDLVVLEFEDARTLGYQAQEMLFVEGVTSPALAAEELSAYQRLLPTSSTVSATLLVEITDQARVKPELERLAGLHDSVRLEVGDVRCPATDVPPPDDAPSDRTYSVHFLRFTVPSEAVQALQGDAPARVVVDHPEYAASTELPAQLRAQLLADLTA
jgi:hypothetical protein